MNRIWALALLLYMALILFVSTRPNLHAPGPEFEYKDKLAHVAEYAVLGVLAAAAFGRAVDRSRAVAFMVLFAACATFGSIDEMTQSHVPGRFMDVFDWVADMIGAAIERYDGMDRYEARDAIVTEAGIVRPT